MVKQANEALGLLFEYSVYISTINILDLIFILVIFLV